MLIGTFPLFSLMYETAFSSISHIKKVFAWLVRLFSEPGVLRLPLRARVEHELHGARGLHWTRGGHRPGPSIPAGPNAPSADGLPGWSGGRRASERRFPRSRMYAVKLFANPGSSVRCLHRSGLETCHLLARSEPMLRVIWHIRRDLITSPMHCVVPHIPIGHLRTSLLHPRRETSECRRIFIPLRFPPPIRRSYFSTHTTLKF